MRTIALIGYSGHAFVAYETFFSQGQIITAYTDCEEKGFNPYSLMWLGDENNPEVIEELRSYNYFISIGDNLLRRKVSLKLIQELGMNPESAIHKSAIISQSIRSGYRNMFAPRVVINPQVQIANGVILNTGCITEHECIISDYAHIAPGAILCGDVNVGENSFVGAGSVVKQGVKIGKNVIIGAGSVVLKDIDDNKKIVGNPQRII